MKTLVIPAQQTHRASVIWLHGLGATCDDFQGILPMFAQAVTDSCRFVFPQAPDQAVTVNNGMVMPAWYDVFGLDANSPPDEKGIRQAQGWLEQLIQAELNAGIASDKILLAGFSQGGAIALQTGLRYPQKLAGILALSTYLPLAQTLAEERHQHNQDIPIFLAHGTHDTVLTLDIAHKTRQHLQQSDYKINWFEYGMEHAICQQEISDINQFLLEHLV